MPEKEFTDADSPTSLGGFSGATLEDRNRFILGQNPVMKNVGGKIRRALEQTRGLHRVLAYINSTKNDRVPFILESIEGLDYAHLLLEFLPLLEEVYSFNDLTDPDWIAPYVDACTTAPIATPSEQLLVLSHIKQTVTGRMLGSGKIPNSPSKFVDKYIKQNLRALSPSQRIGVLLVLDIIFRRIGYIYTLREKHNDNPVSLFVDEVADVKQSHRNGILSMEQKGPILQFRVSRAVITQLSSKRDGALFFHKTRNPILAHACAMGCGHESTERHEHHHHTSIWTAPEQALTGVQSFYFCTKDEIISYMIGGGRTMYNIFQLLFTSPSYNPHKNIEKHRKAYYERCMEEYRQVLLLGLICARLLEKKIGTRNAVDVLTFIHFKSWKSELKRKFGIHISPKLEVAVSHPGREKDIFDALEKL